VLLGGQQWPVDASRSTDSSLFFDTRACQGDIVVVAAGQASNALPYTFLSLMAIPRVRPAHTVVFFVLRTLTALRSCFFGLTGGQDVLEVQISVGLETCKSVKCVCVCRGVPVVGRGSTRSAWGR
jgi:hypothetical protein